MSKYGQVRELTKEEQRLMEVFEAVRRQVRDGERTEIERRLRIIYDGVTFYEPFVDPTKRRAVFIVLGGEWVYLN